MLYLLAKVECHIGTITRKKGNVVLVSKCSANCVQDISDHVTCVMYMLNYRQSPSIDIPEISTGNPEYGFPGTMVSKPE